MGIDVEDISNKLMDRGAHLPCHRCGNKTFAIIDVYSKFIIDEDTEYLPSKINGRSIPVVLVACENCGAITPHAFKALNLPINGGQKND